MNETIRELLDRKISQTKIDLQNARIQKGIDIAKADARIAAYTEKLDAYESLIDLDWVSYARAELGLDSK